MEWPVEIGVVLELLEVGQGRIPRPSLGAERAPLVVVAGRPPVGDHRVDRRPAAEHASLLIAPGCPPFGLAERRAEEGFEIGPDVCRIEKGAPRIAAPHMRRHRCAGEVGAGLDQRHPERRVFAEPRRQNAAGGTAAQDQKIHRRPRLHAFKSHTPPSR